MPQSARISVKITTDLSKGLIAKIKHAQSCLDQSPNHLQIMPCFKNFIINAWPYANKLRLHFEQWWSCIHRNYFFPL